MCLSIPLVGGLIVTIRRRLVLTTSLLAAAALKVKAYRHVEGLSVSRYNRFSRLPIGFEVMGWV